jgi:hypothetical protein
MRYNPSKKDVLLLSWVVLMCALLGAVIGSFLGEPTPFRALGGAPGVIEKSSTRVHRRLTNRCSERPRCLVQAIQPFTI